MKKHYFLFYLLLALLVCGCVDDPPPMPHGANNEVVKFSAREAQRHFESKVITFRQLNFDPASRLQTRSTDLNRNLLTPQWEKARQSSNPEASLIEIPLLTSQTTVVQGNWHYPSGAAIGINRIANQN